MPSDGGLWAWLIIFGGSIAFAEEEYKFDLSEIEKKPYHVGGYLELRPNLLVLDKDACPVQTQIFQPGRRGHDRGLQWKALDRGKL